MTFKNHCSAHFCLCASVHTLQSYEKISVVTGLKFTTFFSDVEEPSSMLRQQLAFQYSHPMLNASAQNKDGVCQFSQTRAANRLP